LTTTFRRYRDFTQAYPYCTHRSLRAGTARSVKTSQPQIKQYLGNTITPSASEPKRP